MEAEFHQIPVKKPLTCPAMRAVIPFIAGILIAESIHIKPLTLLVCSVSGVLLLTVTLLYRHDRIGSFIALIVMCFTGMFACSSFHEIHKPLHVPDKLLNQTVSVEGIIVDDTKIYNGNTLFTLQCHILYADTITYSDSGLLPCFVYNKIIPLSEGSRVVVQGKIKHYRHPLTSRNTFSAYSMYDFTHSLVTASSQPDPIIIETGKSLFSSTRNHLSRMIDLYHFGGHGDLLKAITFGERSELASETKAQFARSGIAHILAVSGLHIGIVIIIVNFILSFLPFHKKIRHLLVMCLIIWYAGICGFRPPVLRAAIMVSMVFGALFFERKKNVENSIFIALFAILAFNPRSLLGPSLQLSFAAVWAITTFYLPIMNAIEKKIHLIKPLTYLTGIFIVSTLAYIATAQITAMHFGNLPLLSIPVNLFAVPLTFFIVSFGIVSVSVISLGPIAAPIAALLTFLTGILLQMLSGLAEFVAGFTYSSIAVEHITPLFGVSFAAWLYVISRAQGRYNFQKAILYIPLMLLLLYTWNMPALTSLSGRKSGSVVFYDVGQGDAALVTYGHTHHFLVDTGPQYTHGDAGTSVIVPNLKSAGITHLDGVFLSHTHADHTGGLNSILKNIRVDHIFCRQSIADSLKALFGDSVFGISAGDSIAFKEGGILILSPWSALQKKSSVGENDCSLLIRFDLCGLRLLFPGDIEEKIQHHLLAWKAALESDILKVPHHGAPDLYSEFIRVIHPMVTIISCGADNRYNHPAETTLVILEKSGCKVYRTDRDGTIQITLPALHISTF